MCAYLLGLFCPKVVVISSRFSTHFARNSGYLVQQISKELNRGESDSPVIVKYSLLQLRKQQGDGTFSKASDDPLTGSKSGFSDKFILISQSLNYYKINSLYYNRRRAHI